MVVLFTQTDDKVELKVALGPEGEMLLDTTGASSVDITEMVKAVTAKPDTKVTLSLFRTASEQVSVEMAEAMHIFARYVIPVCPAPVSTTVAAKPVAKEKKRWGRCQFCGDETEILNIPGFMTCKTCAQIELGRCRELLRKQKELSNDKV